MKLLKFLAIVPIIAATLLFSEEEKHVPVGTRPMSEEAIAQIESEKPQRLSDEVIEEEGATLETAGFGFDRYPPIYYAPSYHVISSITVLPNDNCALELEDGSVWKISSYDKAQVFSWRNESSDICYLTITQNNRWFSKYNYRIVHRNGTSVEANLHIGPVVLGPHSRYIVGIDYTQREILLSDNTRYEISYLDTSVFKDWALNDYLIIGTNSNNSIWDSSNDILFINVNMNNSARGKQF